MFNPAKCATGIEIRNGGKQVVKIGGADWIGVFGTEAVQEGKYRWVLHLDTPSQNLVIGVADPSIDPERHPTRASCLCITFMKMRNSLRANACANAHPRLLLSNGDPCHGHKCTPPQLIQCV